MRYTRQVLALLALAAGWGVLVADGPALDVPEDARCKRFDVQYEFQTHCMGELARGILRLEDGSDCRSSPQYQGEYQGERFWALELALEPIRAQGLHVQRVTALYKTSILTPVGFDFEIKGEPVPPPSEPVPPPSESVPPPDEPVDAPQNPDMTAPIFVCKDARTHETLAVNKDYLCENKENPSETCELKLSHQTRE